MASEVLLHSVYRAARKAFPPALKGPVGLPQVQPLMELLDRLQPEDCGLNLPAHSVEDAARSQIRYLHIHSEPTFSIGIFVLPPKCSIPLHDHPHMCVLSRM